MASSRSPLSPSEVIERLRARFGDDIRTAQEVHGHPVVTVSRDRYVEVARFLRDDPDLAFDFFDFLGAVDYRPKGRGFEVVTHLFSTRHGHNVRLKVECDPEDPRCPTLTEVWPGANWHEREAWELFGIVFEGHPHLVKLLLPEQFEGHPLRKDFVLMTREAKPWPGAAEGEEIEE
ncbi:MAG TPA: NADH-quinone oxidoreductase subunit C [Actinomycetota bacterium]|nr:NADH-quinone oxidoreductase subunit C [Actinomycetota bacterium]